MTALAPLPSFGGGDGSPSDGVSQLNSFSSGSAVLHDGISSMVLDGSGHLYAAGITESSMGARNGGGTNIFVAKFDIATGALDFTFGNGDGSDGDGIFQFGNPLKSAYSNEYVTKLIIDNSDNHLFIIGATTGAFGGSYGGLYDGYVLKISAATGEPDFDFGDGNDNDAIVQFNALNSGDTLYNEFLVDLTLDGSGNLFVTGHSDSEFGGANSFPGIDFNVFVLKMNTSSGILDTNFGDGDGTDSDGVLFINETLMPLPPNQDEEAAKIIYSAGKLFVVGKTQSDLGGSIDFGLFYTDGFVLKMDAITGVLDNGFGAGDGRPSDGIIQLNSIYTNATSSRDGLIDIIQLASNDLLVLGHTVDSLGGLNSTSTTHGDGVDMDGILQMNTINGGGSTKDDTMESIVLTNTGHIFIGGSTSGSTSELNGGGSDAFWVKINGISGQVGP